MRLPLPATRGTAHSHSAIELLVVTSRHLWVILRPTSYEFASHFLNLHRLFFCHLEKCQQPVSVGFVRDEACSCAVTFQASLNAKMSLTSPSRQTGCGCFARSGNLMSYCWKRWLHRNANITYCIEIGVLAGWCRKTALMLQGSAFVARQSMKPLHRFFLHKTIILPRGIDN